MLFQVQLNSSFAELFGAHTKFPRWKVLWGSARRFAAKAP